MLPAEEKFYRMDAEHGSETKTYFWWVFQNRAQCPGVTEEHSGPFLGDHEAIWALCRLDPRMTERNTQYQTFNGDTYFVVLQQPRTGWVVVTNSSRTEFLDVSPEVINAESNEQHT